MVKSKRIATTIAMQVSVPICELIRKLDVASTLKPRVRMSVVIRIADPTVSKAKRTASSLLRPFSRRARTYLARK